MLVWYIATCGVVRIVYLIKAAPWLLVTGVIFQAVKGFSTSRPSLEETTAYGSLVWVGKYSWSSFLTAVSVGIAQRTLA